ncbi:hypothetical protein MW871_03190 [Flavobacterium sp. I-SCBP12n]|uniref:Uncharacterized protein n=1 Tax=Flavobacterium pygoscelis TaxID=2893176 RepID=A0A9X2BP04_9FLAO|nr:hypothetical protein [Flavobacterium pygoscelis]MCK8140891.1 hypothetical protein [Flavobacterium pygoscelis]
MKLLIITAVLDFENDIKQMLKKAHVKTFTFKEVKGFTDLSEEAIESNWFAGDIHETESILFYAFVKKENIDSLFDLVNDFNAKQVTKSNIHIAVLNIEKSN